MVFSAGQGELTAKINADASGFRSGMQSAMQALGGFRGAVGLASGAVVAFAGAKGLGAAVSSAAQFEEQMLSLRSTVGESAQTVQSLRGDVMDLAAETGQSTNQIVDGFRFARSAGLDMAEAQELVETATKASAAGFGEQSELVRTATTAMNAWSKEVESGSEFLDTMTAAAQNADIRVSDLASAFRRNINMASNLGLTLEETLSSLSAISGAVGSASRGGRLLQQTFNGLLSPSGQAADAISDVFGSVDKMRRSLQNDGLLSTLLELQDGLQESGRGMEDVFRSSRKLEGVLAQLAGDGERTKDIMAELGENTGNVQKAFDDTEGTLRRWRKTQKRFNNLMIEFGTSILPPVNDALETTSNFFSTISGNIQNVSGVVENDLIRSLENIENMRIGPPEVAQQQEGIFTQEQFDRMEQQFEKTMTVMERTDAPESLQKRVRKKMNQAINRGLEQGFKSETVVNQFSDTSNNLRNLLRASSSQGITEGADNGAKTTKEKTKDATKSGAKSGLESGISQAKFSKKFAQGFKNSISKQLRPTLEQFQKENAGALFDPFGDPEEQRRMLKRLRNMGDDEIQGLSEDARRTLSNNLALAMRDGFKDGSEAADQIMQAMINSLTQRMATNLVDGLSIGMKSLANQGGATGSIFSELMGGIDMLFGDTPGVMEAEQGGVAAFKPGDKFAAAQNESDLRNMVGSGRGKNAGGDQVNVNETYNINYEIRAVDAQSVQQLFERNGDQIAAQVTDRIRRRSEVQKAVRDAAK